MSQAISIIRQVYPKQYFNPLSFPKLEILLCNYIKQQKIPDSMIKASISVKNLIEKNPEMILSIFDFVITKIIKRFYFNHSFHDDVKQDVILELLKKRFQYIKTNYDDSVPFTIYFSKIIINICLDIQKKQRFKKEFSIENDRIFDQIPNEETENTEFSPKIINCLLAILKKNYNARLICVFKTRQNIPISRLELKNAFPLISPWDLKKTNKINFKIMVMLCNKYDRKKTKPESLNRLLNLYLSSIRELYNTSAGFDLNSEGFTLLLVHIFTNDLIADEQ